MNKFLFSCQKRCLKYIVMALLLYPLSALAAQGQIVVKGQSLTIPQAIRLIEKSSQYTFFYNANDLKNTTLKSIDCKGSIDDVLNEVFKVMLLKGMKLFLKLRKRKVHNRKRQKSLV